MDEIDTVFVRNLPYDFTDAQLEAAFEDLGYTTSTQPVFTFYLAVTFLLLSLNV